MISEIEHWDNFGDSVVFWCVCDSEEIPNELKEKAMIIDGENYDETCFGVCVIFDSEGFHMCQDSPNCEIYYIDNDGDKHWFEYVFTYEESEDFFDACFEEITASLPK
jgi:hypothetical protein